MYTLSDRCDCDKSQGGDGWVLLELVDAGGFENALWFPAIETTTGWVVFESAAQLFNPGISGIFEEADWTAIKHEDLLPGGDSEWVLSFHKDRSDSDMGINEFETEAWSVTVVCAREGAEAWCTEPLLLAYDYTRDIEFPEEEGEEVEGEEEFEHEGLPVNEKFSCTLELGAKVVVSDVAGNRAATEGGTGTFRQLAAGEHDLATLLGKPSAPK